MATDALTTIFEVHRLTGLDWAGPARTPYPERPGAAGESTSWRLPSVRSFDGPAPGPAEVEEILRQAYGAGRRGRPLPSAGGIYGLQFHLITGPDCCLYRANPQGRLVAVPGPALDPGEVSACLFHQIAGPVSLIVIGAQPARAAERYGLRSYRYLLLETGHCAQEILRAGQQLGLRSCPLGAFDDTGVTRLIGATLAGYLPLYIVALGRDREDG